MLQRRSVWLVLLTITLSYNSDSEKLGNTTALFGKLLNTRISQEVYTRNTTGVTEGVTGSRRLPLDQHKGHNYKITSISIVMITGSNLS